LATQEKGDRSRTIQLLTSVFMDGPSAWERRPCREFF
jgi:hypothetical protein